MKTVALVLVLGLAINSIMSNPIDQDWLQFKQKYNKTYLNEEDEQVHRAAFLITKEKVEAHNKKSPKETSFSLGINFFSDFTSQEFSRMVIESQDFASSRNYTGSSTLIDEILTNENEEIPNSLDWRETGDRVTAVRQQGKCGSCLPFALTAMLEGQLTTHGKVKKLVYLSPQNIKDCIEGSTCQEGTSLKKLVENLARIQGVESEETYPYQMKDQQCRFESENAVILIKGFEMLSSRDEEDMKKIVALYGPVAVVMSVNGMFFTYQGGVFKDDTYTESIGLHAVLIVGYGTSDEGIDYWLMKNSWGPFWGDEGYFKLARNSGNQCGVANSPIIAAFDQDSQI